MPELTTPRLTLRLAQPTDAAAITQFYIQNDAHFAPTDPPFPPNFLTEADWKERAQKSAEEFAAGQSARFFLFERTTHAVVLPIDAHHGDVKLPLSPLGES
jgi:hypothetical protein